MNGVLPMCLLPFPNNNGETLAKKLTKLFSGPNTCMNRPFCYHILDCCKFPLSNSFDLTNGCLFIQTNSAYILNISEFDVYSPLKLCLYCYCSVRIAARQQIIFTELFTILFENEAVANIAFVFNCMEAGS